jgi:hypothetical protein
MLKSIVIVVILPHAKTGSILFSAVDRFQSGRIMQHFTERSFGAGVDFFGILIQSPGWSRKWSDRIALSKSKQSVEVALCIGDAEIQSLSSDECFSFLLGVIENRLPGLVEGAAIPEFCGQDFVNDLIALTKTL